MNSFRVLKSIQADYRQSVESTQVIKDQRVKDLITKAIEEDELLWRDAYVQISRRFKKGAPLRRLVDEGALHPDVLKVFYRDEKDRQSPPIDLHMHQLKSVRAYAEGRNYLVSTGTSSGKSNCFFIPIVDACLKRKGQKGIKAIVVYPMNALANSQYWNMANRLVGTGLRIGRFTGQTAKTEEEAMKGYRGEPLESEVLDRQTMFDNPPDILITNYKMLEYMLLRPHDRRMLNPEWAEALQFLVLDEAHSYEGRRGADVAFLIRRVKRRMKGIGRVRCVATSATLVKHPDPSKEFEMVKEFFSQLFGEELGDYITEEEEELPSPDLGFPSSITPDFALIDRFDEDPEQIRWELAERVLGRPLSSELRNAESLRDLLDRTELFHRVYQALMERPKTVREIVVSLVDTGLDEGTLRFLVEGLLRLGMTELSDGRQIIPTRLHAFFQSGGRIAECLKCGYMTVRGETSCPTCAEGGEPLPLYPLHFCRTCGEKLYGVSQNDSGRITPWEMDNREIDGEYGFLMRLGSKDDFANVTALCDEEWFKKDGTARKDKVGHVPSLEVLDPTFRKLSGGGPGSYFSFSPSPLMMCPSCGVRTLGRERTALSFVSRQSRADAVNALALGILAAKPDPQKPKTLVFVDSVQEAAYHAGHMDDWYTHLVFRSLLYRVLKESGKGLTVSAIANALFTLLDESGIFAAISPKLDLNVSIVRKAVLTYLEFCVLDQAGMTSGSDVGLEQAGLTSVDFDELDDCVEEFARLHHLSKEEAHDLLRVLLDEFRERRAFDNPAWIDRDDFNKSTKRMTPDGEDTPHWFFQEPPQNTPYAHFLSGSEQVVQKVGTGPQSRLRRWIGDTYGKKELLDDAIEFLKRQKYLVERDINHYGRMAKGLVLDSSIILMESGAKDGKRCPSCRRVYRWRGHTACVNKRCGGSLQPVDASALLSTSYMTGERTLPTLEVEDHSRLVNDENRVKREQSFSSDDNKDRLNVLVCTPTLELGVDIGALGTVLLRGVPPSPSNYVQRAGRAGRRGKGAVIVTFCSTQGQNPHDQHFYRHPEQMIAGRILVPRFDLANEGLQHAHANAIVSEVADTNVLSDNRYNFEETEQLPAVPEVSASRIEMMLEQVGQNRAEVDNAVRGVLLDDASIPKLTESLVMGWVDAYVPLFRQQLERLIEEYRSVHAEWTTLQNSLDAAPVGQVSDALKMRLLEIIGNGKSTNRSPYRMDQWLASTGFLPGYAFGREFIIVRFPNPEDDVVADPMRALREFGPKAICYAQKRQWVVLWAQRGQEDVRRFKGCQCGRVLDVTLGARSTCDCGQTLGPEMRGRKMPSVRVKPGARVTRAETVRQSRMFAISDLANLEAPSRQMAYDLGDEGQLTLSFHPNCEVTSINFRSLFADSDKKVVQVGASDQTRPGFRIEKDQWKLRGEDGETGSDADFFALYATARHDLLSMRIRSEHALPTCFAMTLMNSLRLAVSETLRQSPTEVRAIQLPSAKTTEAQILFFETTSGSASALERVLDETMVREMATCALELLHFDPNGGELESGSVCAKACYDCLLGYHNQREHPLLDRKSVEPVLRRLVESEPTPVDLEAFDRIIASLHGPGAENEKYFLACLRGRGFPPPEKRHFTVTTTGGAIVLEVDYQVNGVNVFVDGSIHFEKWVAGMDAVKRDALKDEGVLFDVFSSGEEDAFFARLRNFAG
jgi:Lhr-like helicase